MIDTKHETTPAIRAVDLTKTYPLRDGAKLVALGPISFEVRRGEFVSVVGPSGCGKTTALRIIDGVIEPDPGSKVEILGRPLQGPGPDRARVFQTFALLPWKSIRANIELGLKFAGVDKSARAEVSNKYLHMVGLDGFGDRYPHELSGGMQQRVGIARALALEPEILLADEPFGSVDALTREVLQTELLRIWSETRTSVLFITHSIDEAVLLSDRVLVFSHRPAKMLADLDIDVPRPRNAASRLQPRFGELRDFIWQTLSSELSNAPLVDQ
jgi:NitT/TauT family transport system ATP-binding protein